MKRNALLSITLLSLLALQPTATALASGDACSHTYTTTADFQEGVLVNVNTDTPDQLQLNETTTPFPFVNIANSERGTTVRVDVNTGEVLGEYRTAPEGRGLNPSRTTVDLFGNVWVGNRNEQGLVDGTPSGSIVKIGVVIGGTRTDADGNPDPNGEYLQPPFLYSTCTDRDGDGLIKTSRGLGDILDWPDVTDGIGGTDARVEDADDECILIYQRLPSAVRTRHVSVDADNNVWVSGYPPQQLFYKLQGSDGHILDSFDAADFGCGGYGGLVDGDGVIWSASISQSRLLRYDPATDTGSCINVTTSYGLGIDSSGNIWNSMWSQNSIVKIAPDGTIFPGFPKTTGGASGDRGVAVSPADDNVWVANSYGTDVSRLDNDGNLLKVIPVGLTPTGVAVDSNGKIWVTNLGSDNAMRIDPNGGSDSLGAVDLTVPLGANAGPYNYSDMTGVIAIGTTAPQGTWNIVKDGLEPGAEWGTMTWSSDEPAGSGVKVEVRAADSEADLGGELFVEVENGVSICEENAAIGQFLEIRVTLSRGDSLTASPILFDLDVRCCNQPPDCSDAHLSSDGCWPPNHMFNLVEVLGVTDPDGDPVTITITGIMQDEPVRQQGTGSGNTCPDGVMVDTVGDGSPDAAGLRCERAGSRKTPGNGRVYHVSFLASDGQGGACEGTVTYCVVHDQRPEAACIDDGPLYDSRFCPTEGGIAADVDEGDLVFSLEEFETLTPAPLFLRGDVNWDTERDVSDGISILRALFAQGYELDCPDAADVNDDGVTDISDAAALFAFLFLGGQDVPPPAVVVGEDPTFDWIDCE